MTKRRNKKQALMASMLSLILCVSMLLGTTMAWFTDTVANKGNRIVTGELGVELWKYNDTKSEYEDISDGTGDIFMTQSGEGEPLNGDQWEPGKTEVVFLQVKNVENLALNYRAVLEVANNSEGTKKTLPLESAFKYALIPNVAAAGGTGSVMNYAELENPSWETLCGLEGAVIGAMPAGTTKMGFEGDLLKEESDYLMLAVHMDEYADNNYQGLDIEIDVKIEAKQMSEESDSFGNTYDAKAEYPLNAYHVSVDGDDSNPGTESKPFATIARANEVISADTERKGASVEVLIHGGTYLFTEDIKLGAASGASDGNKVTYKAAGDGEVVFSGFRQIPFQNVIKLPDGSYVGKLMPEEVRANVMKIELYTMGWGLTKENFSLTKHIDGTEKTRDNGDTIQYFTLLLNGKEQPLAQWPNYGEYETISTVIDAGGTTKGSKGAIIEYTSPNIDNWANTNQAKNGLKNAIVRGYMGMNYREEWNRIDHNNVDSINKTLQFKYRTDFGVNEGRNWSIVNLPQELDVPGEYCIESVQGALSLYWYPPYELTENDVVELAVARDVSLIIEGAENIVFDGIKFTGISNSDLEEGVITIKNSNNIEVRNCTFTHNECGANIVITGKDNLVETCGFYNCGAAGVFLYGGGDYETLERQNNVIMNNHFYNVGTGNLANTAAAVTNFVSQNFNEKTVGNDVKNNLIHRIYGCVSVWFNGAEYNISYNEISNSLRNLADYGVIYVGRTPNSQGNVISYNYVHDFGSLRDASMSTNAIYLDDWQSGQVVNNNIIVSNTDAKAYGIFSVGAFNTLNYNILANSTKGVFQGSRTSLVGQNTILNTFTNRLPQMTEAMKAKYPDMVTLNNALVQGEVFPIMNNEIIGNIAYQAAFDIHQSAYDLNGNIANNLTADDASVFVDPDNHDWRVTSAYATANNLNENVMTEANFSMDEIGIQKDVWEITNPLDSFKQIAPQNGADNIQPEDVTLNWEQALFADEYRYVVAEDAEFKTIVKEGTSSYEHVNVGSLDPNKTYYWKITAVNTTRQLGAEWNSEGVYSFTTGEKKADKSKLEWAITDATTVIDAVVDGTEEPVVGTFKPGSKNKLDVILGEAVAVNAKVDATQEEVDEMTSKLTAAYQGIDAYKYKGYVTIDTSAASKWKANHTNATLSVDNGILSVGGGKVVEYQEQIPNYNMIAFKAKGVLATGEDITVNANRGNLVIGFRRADAGVADMWKGASYYFWIKPDVIELQKSGEIVTSVVNYAEGEYLHIKNDEWQDYKIEAIDQEGGSVKIVLYVAGQEVLSFVDSNGALHETGTFAVSSKFGVQIKGLEQSEIPNTIY